MIAHDCAPRQRPVDPTGADPMTAVPTEVLAAIDQRDAARRAGHGR